MSNKIVGLKKPDTIEAYRFDPKTFWDEYEDWPEWILEGVQADHIKRRYEKHESAPFTACRGTPIREVGYFVAPDHYSEPVVRFVSKEKFEKYYEVLEV